MDNISVSKATLGRLPQYLSFLKELPPDEFPYISATAISKKLTYGEVQVRKDLSSVSSAGRPKLGYVTADLINTIEDCLGCNSLISAVLVGAGKLGRALLEYDGFEKYGIKISAAFDRNEQALNLNGKVEVLPINQLETFCRSKGVQLGIITVGEGSAQSVCDEMVKSGISAIWNFAPCRLSVPDGVLLQNENLALSLAHLKNQLNNSGKP